MSVHSLDEKRAQRARVVKSITAQYPNHQREATWADYDRRLADIPTEELEASVDACLSTWEGMAPPKPGHIRARWERAKQDEAYRAQQGDRWGSEPWPGGMSPDGSRWITADEARRRLEALKVEHPDAWDQSAPDLSSCADSEALRAGLQAYMARILRLAYERVIDRWGIEGETRRREYDAARQDEEVLF